MTEAKKYKGVIAGFIAIIALVFGLTISVSLSDNAYADEVYTDENTCIQVENCEDGTNDAGISLYASSTNVSSKFGDVDSGQWYTEYIQWAYDNDIMTGYNSSTWGTGDAITRADFVTILWRWYAPAEYYDDSLSIPNNTTGLPDVANATYWTAAANWAVEKGIVTGKQLADGSYIFDPYANISREEMVTILWRLSGEYYVSTWLADDWWPIGYSDFPDYKNVSSYAELAMAWAYGVGIMSGAQHSDGIYWLEPQRAATRAETAKLFDKGQDKIDVEVRLYLRDSSIGYCSHICVTDNYIDRDSNGYAISPYKGNYQYRISAVSTAFGLSATPDDGYSITCVRAKAYKSFADCPSSTALSVKDLENMTWDLDIVAKNDSDGKKRYWVDFPDDVADYSAVKYYFNLTTSEYADIVSRAYSLAKDHVPYSDDNLNAFSGLNGVGLVNYCVTGNAGYLNRFTASDIAAWSLDFSIDGVHPAGCICQNVNYTYDFGIYIGNVGAIVVDKNEGVKVVPDFIAATGWPHIPPEIGSW